MKLPINWLKKYVKTTKTPKQLAESFTSLGLMLDKIVETPQGTVLDLEHRMDRSDWLSILGCARDLAAFENLELIYPELYTKKGKTPTKSQKVDIKVECPELVNRFNTRVFRNIKIKESPKWLKECLEAYGMPSINNIVDITNFVMVELGQPMHAQDLAKMAKPEIITRRAKPGEKVTTLLGETLELDTDMFVLTQDGKATVIGGIVGGQETGIDEKTTDIVLDAGNYNQNNIRKSSRKLKVQNETVSRFDKFLHPDLTELAIQRATYLILELAGGDYYENVDWYPKKSPLKKLKFRMERLEKISGMEFKLKEVKDILKRLEYKILETKESYLLIEVPYFRTDVEIEDDIIADVLRINDYKNIPINLIQAAPPKEITPKIYKFEEKLRDILVGIGLHEFITDPIVSRNGKPNEVVLENALSSDKSALRTTIYETLLPIGQHYKKHKINEIGIFEVGMTYHIDYQTEKPKYIERRTLQVIYQNERFSPAQNANRVKRLLVAVLDNLGIVNARFEKVAGTGNTAEIKIANTKIGEITIDSFYLLTEELLAHKGKPTRVISEFENEQTENLSLVLEAGQTFGAIYNEIAAQVKRAAVIEEYIMDNGKKSILVEVVYKTNNNEKERNDLIALISKNPNVEIRR